jgi:hypothetical protein
LYLGEPLRAPASCLRTRLVRSRRAIRYITRITASPCCGWFRFYPSRSRAPKLLAQLWGAAASPRFQPIYLFDGLAYLFDGLAYLFDRLAYLFDRLAYLFDRLAYLFDRLAYVFDGLAYLFDRLAYLFDRLAYLFDRLAYLFDGLAYLFDGLAYLFDRLAYLFDRLAYLFDELALKKRSRLPLHANSREGVGGWVKREG